MKEPMVIARVQDLGDVALKLMGLCFLFFGFLSMPLRFTAALHSAGSDFRKLGATMSGVVLLVLGVCLIRWSAALSRKLFGVTGTAALPLQISAELQAIIFRVMGVYALINGIPSLVQLLIAMTDEGGIGAANLLPMYGTQVALGLVLFLYRSSWGSRLWKQPRPFLGHNYGDGAS